MSIFKCKWPSKLGQSSFLEPLLSHHLRMFLFKAGLLSPICISSSVLFDNLFQLRKGASKLCIAHFVKVIIDDNSGIKRLILFCRCFYQIEDKSWFPILFCVVLLGITEGTNKNPFINKERKEQTQEDHHVWFSDMQIPHWWKIIFSTNVTGLGWG